MTADVEGEEVFMQTFNLLLSPDRRQFFRIKHLDAPLMIAGKECEEALSKVVNLLLTHNRTQPFLKKGGCVLDGARIRMGIKGILRLMPWATVR